MRNLHRKAFLAVICILFNNAVSSQAIEIICDAKGCDSALPAPNQHKYFAQISNFIKCFQGSACNFKWEVTNGIIVESGSNTYQGDVKNQVTVNWNNVNGNGTLKVTVAKPASQKDGCPIAPKA